MGRLIISISEALPADQPVEHTEYMIANHHTSYFYSVDLQA